MEVVVLPQARLDIAGILAWTEENFSPQTLRRYARLMATAIEQVARNPELPAAVRGPKSPTVAEPTISSSAASRRVEPATGYAARVTSCSIV